MMNVGRCFFNPKTSIEALLAVVKELPSPLPNVKYDFDEERYTLKPKQENPDIVITINDKDHLLGWIGGKKGHIFSKESNPDSQAYHVYQGEVGFSTHEKIGTTNVQDCVALIIQDKKIKKTALAHISCATSEESIQAMLSYMPDGDKEVIMIGGRYDAGRYNVEKILRVLARCKHDVFINTSYVCDSSYFITHITHGQSFHAKFLILERPFDWLSKLICI